MYSGIWIERIAWAFPNMQSKTNGLTWPGNSVYTLVWFGSPNNELYGLWVPSWCPARARKLIHSFIYYWTTQSLQFSKSNWRIQAMVEPILQPYLGKEVSQQSYPTVLSQWRIHPFLSSELEQLPHPKIDHNSRPHLPKDMASRHTQKQRLSCFVKNCLC